jgi:hypothetical protein
LPDRLPAATQNGGTDTPGWITERKERSMNDRGAKLMAGVTVLGLGALGGVAMGTNRGLPPAQRLAANGSGSIVTSASGAAATRSTSATASTRAPIVTRASGGAAPAEIDD